jgi:hypothetical protein
MTISRRKCKLANHDFKDVDLRDYKDVIINTINDTLPGKHPEVHKSYFATDVLNQSEAVTLGRALAKVDCLKNFGKTVTTFRIFDGKIHIEEIRPMTTQDAIDFKDRDLIVEKDEKTTISKTIIRGGRMK